MIGKVKRGGRVGGLLRYLFGPGRANEHRDPHLIGAWDEARELEPHSQGDRRLLAPLTALLEQPLAASPVAPGKRVWHCSIRSAPGDRRLDDSEWAEVARDVVDRTGLARRGDDGACRWVAVRHADDHIHVVVTLARQDGALARTPNDFYRVGEACRAAEARLCLTSTAPRDRTAAKRPSRAETEKATRSGRRESPRVALRRQVRMSAAATSDPRAFLAHLSAAGVLVRARRSNVEPDQITGYAVALPGDRSATGNPVWFSGGKLAADLTLPQLQARWRQTATGTDLATHRLSGASRGSAWEHASRAAARGAADVRRLAVSDPGAAADAAHAAASTLAVAARVIEGRRGGPLTDASDIYDRASRDLWARVPRRTRTGEGLRLAARALALTGRASRDESTDVLTLVTSLAALTEAVANLRHTQQRSVQAHAARAAAERLRSATPTRTGPPPPDLQRARARGHRRPEGATR